MQVRILGVDVFDPATGDIRSGDTDSIAAWFIDTDYDDGDEPPGFWAEVGIDPIKIQTSSRDYYTLRCYLDDDPVFLGSDGTILARFHRAGERWISQRIGAPLSGGYVPR